MLQSKGSEKDGEKRRREREREKKKGEEKEKPGQANVSSMACKALKRPPWPCSTGPGCTCSPLTHRKTTAQTAHSMVSSRDAFPYIAPYRLLLGI